MTNPCDDDALLAVCRTAYRRIMENKGSAGAAEEAVRFDLRRAGFEVVSDESDLTVGLKTVLAMLADGRYIQLDAFGGWHVHRYPLPV